MFLSGEAYVQTRRVGGSIVVTIPKEIIELENINEHEIVKIKVEKIRKSYFGAFKDLVPFNEKEYRMASCRE